MFKNVFSVEIFNSNTSANDNDDDDNAIDANKKESSELHYLQCDNYLGPNWSELLRRDLQRHKRLETYVNESQLVLRRQVSSSNLKTSPSKTTANIIDLNKLSSRYPVLHEVVKVICRLYNEYSGIFLFLTPPRFKRQLML